MLLYLLLGVIYSQVLLSMASIEEHKTSINATSNFAFSLYKNCLSEKSNTLIVSPLSIEAALSLLYLGADGKTAEEFQENMHLPADKNIVLTQISSNLSKLKENSSGTIDFANHLYVDTKLEINDEYLSMTKPLSNGIKNLKFSEMPEESRKIINREIEKSTRNKIKEALQEGYIKQDTRLILVNALYFKGYWDKKFDPEETTSKPFHILPSVTKNVDMMYVNSKIPYIHLIELKSSAVILQYKDSTLVMAVILPDELDGLSYLENHLQHIDIIKVMIENASLSTVDLYLPKFKIESTLSLNEDLRKMGLTTMCDEYTAEFSGISKSTGLFVSDIIHKVFIEVNEEGSEAGAVTAAGVRMKRSVPSYPIEFIADHPFLFLIFDKQSDAVLFMGKITDLPGEILKDEL